MQTCPQCDGRQKVAVTVETHGQSGATKFDMTCPTCDGRGAVTPAAARRHAALVDAWCRCDQTPELLDRLVFVPDRRGVKHHYNCGDCGKLVQVG